MTNQQAFFESFVNIRHTVLGIVLKPLSLLHLLWLYETESPLVNSDRIVTLPDLEVAVIICSSTSSDEIITRLGTKKLSRIKKLRLFLWHRKNKKRNLEGEIKAFLAYNDDCIALPPRLEDRTKQGEVDEQLPWLLLHAASLIKATGWAVDEVFNMPIGKVLWLNMAFGYLETGKTSVISEKEQAAIEALTVKG